MNLVFALAMASSWLTKTQDIAIEGQAKFYSPDIMPRVAVNRGFIDDPSEYGAWLKEEGVDGAAALMRVGDIGRKFTIVWENGTRTRHIAIDCADFKHYSRRLELGDVVEVDWATAQRMGMQGPVPVKIVFDVELKWLKYIPI